MSQRGLFDPPQLEATPLPPLPPLPEPRGFASAGVSRVIQPKAGPFRELASLRSRTSPEELEKAAYGIIRAIDSVYHIGDGAVTIIRRRLIDHFRVSNVPTVGGEG